jgi:hypothetical protein
MHAFLCIAQSRYHTSAVLHDAASCTPPGPSSLAPRHNRDRQRLEQPAQRRQTFCKWCCTGFFARSSGLPDPLESRRSSWAQVPQFILWLWSRTFETRFPGSATRRFLVTSPSMNVSTRETRRCTERIKSPDRLQDNARLLSLPPPPAIDAVCGRTAIRRMQRWPRASSGDLRSGHTPHMQMMPESKPGKAMASSTLVRLGSKRNHGNSARLPQNRPRKQLAGINADTSTGTDHSRQTATAQCVR